MMEKETPISITKHFLKQNILSLVNCNPKENKEEFQQLFDLISQTIRNGESNSALLIGPRASGKTTLVNNVVKKIKNQKDFSTNAIIIKLHGLIHTDDRLALKSITSQLQLDNVVEGKVFGSFAENLSFLLACLKSGQKEVSKSVLIYIEEFDLFCSHHNQTLLYNLLDASQSSQTSMFVLGITCRLNVIELLEKRIKSRFSHRQFFLFTNSEEDINMKLQKISNSLTIPGNMKKLQNIYKKEWNKHIEMLINTQKFKCLIQRWIDIGLNYTILENALYVVVSQLNEKNCKMTIESFQQQLDLYEIDENIQILQDLNVLELCLIIAMKHHTEIYDNQPMNFEMVLSRYRKFACANSSIQTLQRPVIMKAYEHIKNLELISNVDAGESRIQKEYQLFKLLVSSKQILEAIKSSPGLPTEVIQWANSSFV